MDQSSPAPALAMAAVVSPSRSPFTGFGTFRAYGLEFSGSGVLGTPVVPFCPLILESPYSS